MMRRLVLIVLFSALLHTAGSVSAQAPTRQSLTFDVASVKPNRLDDHIVTISVGPGRRFVARGYTLVLLMQRAYGVMDWNVTGGPEWIRTDRFDVTAQSNIPGDMTEEQLQPMLQALLAERFKLQIHRGQKEMDGYGLVVARGGPTLKLAADGQEYRDDFRMTQTGLSAQGLTMTDFARFLSGKLGLIGMDKTGLTGVYAFDLKWTVVPDQTLAGLPNVDPRDPLRRAVFDALDEQAGLRFQPTRGPFDVLVIDRVEQPTAD